MTIRGGGNPHTAMAAMPLGEWTRRLVALPAEADDCFMVGTLHGSTEYKRGSRAIARGQWQAPPRIIAWQTTRSRAVCRRARVGQGQAFGGAEEAPSLTLAARDGDGQYAVGAEECSRRGSNKRINKQGRDKMVCTTLDNESPIQACPRFRRRPASEQPPEKPPALAGLCRRRSALDHNSAPAPRPLIRSRQTVICCRRSGHGCPEPIDRDKLGRNRSGG